MKPEASSPAGARVAGVETVGKVDAAAEVESNEVLEVDANVLSEIEENVAS